MQISWLEDFLALNKSRNFSKAALVRHATQPALSRRIKALEDWYGVPLVDRSTYPVVLTLAGERFAPLCEQVVTDLYRSRREAKAEARAEGRMLRFAMPHSLAINFFPDWWRKERAGTELGARVTAADLSECVGLLLSGACEFLLYYASPDTPSGLENVDLRRRSVGAERLVPVSASAADGTPLFAFDGSCQAVPLLTYTNDSYLGRVTAKVHAQLEAQCDLVQRYESSLVEALKAEALLGEGVAWLPESAIRQEIKEGRLCRVAGDSFAIALAIWLCTPSTALLQTGASQLFKDEEKGPVVE